MVMVSSSVAAQLAASLQPVGTGTD
jgi:hypothetical protein